MNTLDILKFEVESFHNQKLKNLNSDINVLQDLNNKIDFKKILKKISTDQQSLKLLQENSYKHPLGFKKYNLFYSELLKGNLRFHVWDGSFSNEFVEDAHSHRWDFYSLILCGKLKFEEFEVGDIGEEVDYYVCSKNYSGKYNLEYVAKRKIYSVKTNEIHTGQSYFFDNQKIHKITETNVHTKSLVLEMDTSLTHSNIYRKIGSIYKPSNISTISLTEISQDFCFTS